MNTKRVSLMLAALLAAFVLSSCAGGGAARGSTWPGLAADATTAYLSDGAQLFAVRLSDGAQLWMFPAKADAKTSFYATPALLGDGRLVIGSAGTDHCLYVIDTTRVDQGSPAGDCVFSGARDRWIAAPLVVDEVAYAPNNDGTLYVVDLAGRELLWSLPLGSTGHLWAAPVMHEGTLYVASLDHNLYAVDMASHKVIASRDLGGSVTSPPAISPDGSTLYAGSFANKVFALDAATLEVLWEKSTTDWAWGSPVTDDENVYLGDLDGQLYALKASSGAPVWNLKPDGPITGSPLLTGEQVIVTTESGTVYAFDTTGDHAWEATINGKIYTPAVQGGELILIAPLSTAEYFLTALNADGKVVWNFKPQ